MKLSKRKVHILTESQKLAKTQTQNKNMHQNKQTPIQPWKTLEREI